MDFRIVRVSPFLDSAWIFGISKQSQYFWRKDGSCGRIRGIVFRVFTDDFSSILGIELLHFYINLSLSYFATPCATTALKLGISGHWLRSATLYTPVIQVTQCLSCRTSSVSTSTLICRSIFRRIHHTIVINILFAAKKYSSFIGISLSFRPNHSLESQDTPPG